MKKKAIKIAASTAVAASAFVAVAPTQQADAATNATQLVTDAQNAGTVLKWAISVEGSADFVTQPWNQYNAAKKAIAAAEAAAKKLSTSEKLSVDAKLVDAKIQVTRAGYYIDAITSSNKIKDLTAKLDAAIASGNIEAVETAYHNATGEYRKQAKLLDRVYGQTTRDEIRNAVKPAIEKSVASVKNEVTVNMLVKAAAKDLAAGKIADAHVKYAEAQAILDANVLKWETALQKSVTDAKTAAPAIPGNITVDGAAFHGEAGQTYAVVVAVKNTAGAAYNGPVRVTFDNTDKEGPGAYKFASVNGTATTASNATEAIFDAVNGQIVLTVTSTGSTTPDSAVAGGKVKVETFPKGYTVGGTATDTTTSGSLNFYSKVTGSENFGASKEVSFVDVANNYFVTTGDLKKYVLSAAGNVYQDTNNAIVTLDAFKAKLTEGDLVTGTYNSVGGSTLKLLLDRVAQVDFTLDQKVKSGTTAYRVEGNTITLSGAGEAGKLVSIYKGTDNVGALTQVQVGSNGLWSSTVAVTTNDTVFTVRQSATVNELPKTYSDALLAGGTKVVTVTPGKFDATTSMTGNGDKSLTGETAVFNAPKDGSSTVVVTSNAQITVLDGDLTRATYVHGVNGTEIVKSATGFDVKFGAPSTISGGNGVLDGQLTINSVSGISNAYKLQVNASGTISAY